MNAQLRTMNTPTFLRTLRYLIVFSAVCSFAFYGCARQEGAGTATAMSLRDSMRMLRDSLSKLQTNATAQGAKDVLPLKEMYKKLKGAVFLIYSYDDEQDTAQGSGFFVDSSGIAITNYHVLAEAPNAIAILDDSTKYPISQILDYNEDKDYLIFRVAGGDRKFPYVRRTLTSPEIGDDCFAVGNPEGLTQTLSTGIVSGIRFEGSVIQTTTSITFGSSGGALFDHNGDVIGITSGGMGQGNLNFAVNINQIPYEQFIGAPESAIEPLPAVTHAEVKKRLEAYFSTYFSQEFSQMAQYYTDKLDRFYTKFNISARDAAAMLASDWKKSKILSGNIDADWETLEVARTARHTYEVKMNADYHLVREEKNKPSLFHLALVIEMTKDLKIQSIYEDILSSDYDSGDESVNRFPMAAPVPPPPPR